MKTQQRLVAAALLISMLLSPLGGGVMSASAVQTVTTNSELAYEPLAKSESVAYEQHEAGYTVSLDRTADSVTMNITGVPSSRAAENARLYIRTGVDLKPGATYQVSFSLSAAKDQPEYTVCFDGGSEKATYGMLDKRSIKAGETDQVKYQITPRQEGGELVLRLLLGKTEAAGNTLRFSNLAVEEGVRNETGENVVLVDKLVYNAPGAVTFWTNDDSGAKMTSDEKSATLTVTQAPTKGAEVWKIKLLVATGLIPEAGKTYRVRVDLNSSSTGEFEACYNDGNIEKGYDVLYSQRLSEGKLALDRRVYVPSDKENPGELILQLSLGKLRTGTKVTISNIRIEEAATSYTNALPKDFAYDRVKEFVSHRTEWVEKNSKSATPTINWTEGASVWADGGDLTRSGGTLKLNINGGTRVFHAKLGINTDQTLTAGTSYVVSFKLHSDRAYSGVGEGEGDSAIDRGMEILYSYEGAADPGKDSKYGGFWNRTIGAGQTDIVSKPITPDTTGKLKILLQLGGTDNQRNTVTVSDLKIERLVVDSDTNTPIEDNITYPSVSLGSFEARDKLGAISGNAAEKSATISYSDAGAEHQRNLFVNDICTLEAGTYEVSFNISEAVNGCDVLFYGGTDKFSDDVYLAAAAITNGTVKRQITLTEESALTLRIRFGDKAKGKDITISNISVKKITAGPITGEEETVNFTLSERNFEARDGVGTVSFASGSATVNLVPVGTPTVKDWQRDLYIKNICNLEAGKEYVVSFQSSTNIKGGAVYFYKGSENLWNDNEAFKKETTIGNDGKFTATITPEDAITGLSLRVRFGNKAQDENVTISGISVKEVTLNLAASLTGDNFEARDGIGTTSFESGSAKIELNPVGTLMYKDGAAWTGDDGNQLKVESWRRDLFIKNICNLEANKEYVVSFQSSADIGGSSVYFYEGSESMWQDDENQSNGPFKKDAAIGSDGVFNIRITPAKKITNLSLRVRFENKAQDLEAQKAIPVTISNISVKEVTSNLAASLSDSNFEVRDGDKVGTVSFTPGSATAKLKAVGTPIPGDSSDTDNGVKDWQRDLFITDICSLDGDTTYVVSFESNGGINGNDVLFYCGEKDMCQDGESFDTAQINDEGKLTKQISSPAAGGKLALRIKFGEKAPGSNVTISNISVKKIGGSSTDAVSSPLPLTITYPSVNLGSFEARDKLGAISGDASAKSATISYSGAGEPHQRNLFINDICTLEAGTYEVSFNISEAVNGCDVLFYGGPNKFSDDVYLAAAAITNGTVKQQITLTEESALTLRIRFGDKAKDKDITISNIQVTQPNIQTELVKKLTGVASVWADASDGYTVANLTRTENSAKVTFARPSNVDPKNWYAKLHILTGVNYREDKGYRVKFDLEATGTSSSFCVITQLGYDNDLDIRGTWEQSIRAGEKKTITTRAVTPGLGKGELGIDIELGIFDGPYNTYTISNVRVEEIDFEAVEKINNTQTIGTFTSANQLGYYNRIIRGTDFATMQILTAPESGREGWKAKMFIDTGVTPKNNEGIRVVFDVETKDDAVFDVCFNRAEAEGGYDAMYGLRTEGGKMKTIERVFTAKGEGKLNVQLTLGMLEAGNEVTVRNIQVERIAYTYSGKSALPAAISYQAPGAVSYWAHEDYTTTFTSSGDAITANIIGTPIAGAEAWKIKLFLDTGAALKPGKYYRVTANVSGKASQDYEICYNNGGAEAGYDALYGLRLVAGQPQTVEQIISVPADKKDAGNLMLQFNLGKTTMANAVTVGGVKVEEVSFSTTEMLSGNFSYNSDSGINVWTNPDYTATLEGSASQATLHITDVPSTGAEVWKVQMKLNTGAVLSAGKTYLVRADLQAAKGQNYEVCYNNEEIEKGFDALYGQSIAAGKKTTVERKISVPASMTDAGELILQFSVGGPVTNDFTVSNVSVQELSFGTSNGGNSAPDMVISLNDPAGTLDVTQEKLAYKTTQISSNGRDNAITVAGANLRAGERYNIVFTAHANQDITGTFSLNQASNKAVVLSETFQLTPEEKTYSFTTEGQLSEGGFYDLLWQFGSADNQTLSSADVEISNISMYYPPETLEIARNAQDVMVNGEAVKPDAYIINGNNYFKLRDLAVLLNNTDAQFAVRYNKTTNLISLATGNAYTPVGGELTIGADYSASCERSSQKIVIDGKTVDLKAYCIGGNNYFRLRDLDALLGFKVDYIAQSSTVTITSPLTPEAQEKVHAYDIFFLPEIDGESQAYVGDTMPFYDNGVYYIYYLKDGGDSYNHSVYVATTKDFVHYTELDNPVLSASREDVQDSWIGTGSVVKVDQAYYFFYTGFNASGSQEYHEKIMVAKGSSPTSFEKVSGWEIVPPASLNQKNDFRDPQAYYDPETQTISLTVTAAQDGAARILKYTLDKDLRNVKYDGIIFTDPTGAFWNLECSDTFRIGDKWYLTYSGQEDTLWYAMADSCFGPYSAPVRLEGKLFYAGKHVEDGTNSYMVGWARRANSVSSTQEVSGWAGNVAVQKLHQQADGSLTLVPVDSIVSAFNKQKALTASEITLTAGSERSYKAAFTSDESFMLKGEFTYTGTGSFGLAFDFNGREDQYKLISIDPAANKLSLSLNGGAAPITEMKAALQANQKHSFTYIQDGSVGIFYLDGQAALTVRLYGVTDKPIYLFAENNNVTFTSLRQYTR